MSSKRIYDALGVFCILLSVLAAAALLSHVFGFESNFAGSAGKHFSAFLFSVFGYASFLSVLIFASCASFFFKKNRDILLERLFTVFYMILAFSALLSRVLPEATGGSVGKVLSIFLSDKCGKAGSVLILLIINLLGLILGGLVSVESLLSNVKENSRKMGIFIKDKFEKKRVISSEKEIPIVSKTASGKKKLPWFTKETVIIGNPYEEELPLVKDLDTLAAQNLFDEAELKKETLPLLPEKPFQEFKSPKDDIIDALRAPVRIEKRTINITPEPSSYVLPDGVVANRIKNIGESDGTFLNLKNDYCSENEGKIISQIYIEPEIKEEKEIISDKKTVAKEENIEEEILTADELPDENFVVYDDESVFEAQSEAEEIDFEEDLEAESEAEEAEYDEDVVVPATEKVFEEIKLESKYEIPVSLFTFSEAVDYDSWQTEVQKNSVLLVKTLNDFGIPSKVVKVNRGPVITLYEMQIAPGIKVTKIVSLSDDIAMALAASRVRVVAPIPGKSAIGIEIPNALRETVTLGDVLASNEFIHSEMALKVAVGKDILGKPVMLDLKRQPHMLIAGATGAGKSVCVNTIITSLICSYDPNYVRFIMVDPKMVELQLYNGIPHQLTPVITEPDVAPKALKWAIYEMERRYKLLSELSTRDIERYNQKVAAYGRSTLHEKLPYIVIIVDELADLMMVAPKEIENHITRIAQKARAVGIHLVLATQRPSVDIITGVIKANFPARIAFQVAQKIDSRTIIDQNGADKLLGKGDMLYQSPMSSFPVRIQGAFISEDEIVKIVKHANRYGRPKYIDIEEAVRQNEDLDEEDIEESDELFTEALKIVEQSKKASASYLQRRLSIGYNRAARIIERMEELGYVGPQQGSKPREVMV
ncbi:MAG TPA: DNA translocase FtsK 4TM domain-containing protein [Spirochaetota bacterium]|nr:DNA translocase FtsK 4TM domain-containing protein [Spirochaetota bacterium]HOR44937.1 DNA translocase FtsK 4TM domain-containing protein [Spirochaetota bacterium]HPK56955.1 DNA translocase FtsK 4TM domain-containing protein [Spirochaetota bacterium]